MRRMSRVVGDFEMARRDLRLTPQTTIFPTVTRVASEAEGSPAGNA